jgi:3-oxoacyl-[acyl-carrier protein] reductase
MKTAIITGASRGIGRAEAIQLARDGFSVCINCLERMDLAQELSEKLQKEGCSAMAFQADVSVKNEVDAMVEAVHARFGPVDVLVNNAGIAEQCQIQDIREELWDRIFAVNVKGVLNTVQAVLPDMLHRKSGCIINTSSIWGMHGASCESVYSSSKHAVIGLTKSMAAELALSGIRVNCVAPGVIDTDMVKVLGDETLRDLADNTPIGRLGKPEDIAAAVSYLASDGASFVTGQVLTCDGGFIHL